MDTETRVKDGVTPLDSKEPYALNPSYFLADRKVWVIVGALLVLFALGLFSHYLALSLALSVAEPKVYWLTVGALLTTPIAVHWLAPWVHSRGVEVLVATLPAKESRWQTAPAVQRHLGGSGAAGSDVAKNQRLEAFLTAEVAGLERTQEAARDLAALLQSLDSASERITLYASEAAGRDPADQRHSTIRLMVSADVGSPYTYARAFGPAQIVVPLGMPLLPKHSEDDGMRSRRLQAQAVLSHEMAHLLLRDGPAELLSDVRLLSISDALNRSVGALLLMSIGTAILAQLEGSGGATSLETSLSLVLALTLAVICGALGWRSRPTPAREGPTQGQELLRQGSMSLAAAMLVTLLATRSPLMGGAAASTWTVLWLNLGVAYVLGRACTYLGRQQMEHMADEAASRALLNDAELGQALGQAEREGVLMNALNRTHEVCYEQNQVRIIPSFAAGNAGAGGSEALWGRLAHFQEHGLDPDLGDFLESDDEPTRVGRIPSPGSPRASSIARRLVLWVLRAESHLRPIFATHPTLAQRIDGVENPDRMVATDTTVPMLLAAAPLMLLPFLYGALRLDPLIGEVAQSSLLVPLGGFLLLFALVARRPFRRSVSMASESAQALSSFGERALLEVAVSVVQEWWSRPAGWTIALKPETTPHLTTEVTPWGLRAELGRVTAVLVGASVFGVFLGAIYGAFAFDPGDTATRASELMDTSGRGSVELVGAFVAALAPLGSLLTLLSGSFALYLWLRFSELVLWHYMAGQAWWARALAILSATVLAAALATPFCWLVIQLCTVGAELLKSVWPWLGERALWSSVASTRPEARQVLNLALSLWATGVAYAMVQFAFPVHLGAALCWFGHPLRRQWQNILGQPQDEQGDWGPERCACGRSPQAPLRLRPRRVRDPMLGERLPNRSTSTVLIPLILLAVLLPLPRVVLSGLAAISAHTNCVRTATFWGGRPEEHCPAPGVADADDPPEGLSTWRSPALPVGANGGFDLEPPHDLPQLNTGSASPYGQRQVPLGCAEGVRQAAAWMAQLQSCALTPPARKPSVTECGGVLDTNDLDMACDCVWAVAQVAQGEEGAQVQDDTQSQRDARVRAVARLYQVARGYLDASEGVCDDPQRSAWSERWDRWDKHLEGEVAPRVFASAALEDRPDVWLRPDATFPAAPPPLCEGEVEELLDGVAADRGYAYRCLTSAVLERLVLDAEVATVISRAVAWDNANPSAAGAEGARPVDLLPLYSQPFQRLTRIEGRLEMLRALLEANGNAESPDDLCEQVEARDAYADALADEAGREELVSVVGEALPPESSAGSLASVVRGHRLQLSCAYSSRGAKPELDWMAALACSTRGDEGDPTAEELVSPCQVMRRWVGDLDLVGDELGVIGARCMELGVDRKALCEAITFIPERCETASVAAMADEVAQRIIHGAFLPEPVGSATSGTPAPRSEEQLKRHQAQLAMIEHAHCANAKRAQAWPIAHDGLRRSSLCWAYGEQLARAIQDYEPKKEDSPQKSDVANRVHVKVTPAPDFELAQALGWLVIGDDPRYQFDASARELMKEAEHVKEKHGDDAQRCATLGESQRFGWMARIGTAMAHARQARRALIDRVSQAMGSPKTSMAQRSEVWREPCKEASWNDSAARACETRLQEVLVKPVMHTSVVTTLGVVLSEDNILNCARLGMVSAGTLDSSYCPREIECACQELEEGWWMFGSSEELCSENSRIGQSLASATAQCDWPFVTTLAIQAIRNEKHPDEGDGETAAPRATSLSESYSSGNAVAPTAVETTTSSSTSGDQEDNTPADDPADALQVELARRDIGEILEALEDWTLTYIHQHSAFPQYLYNWQAP